MAELPFALGLFLLLPREQLLAQAIGLALVLTFVRQQPAEGRVQHRPVLGWRPPPGSASSTSLSATDAAR